jgi:putative flavoprotein involved in K+ transport
MERRDTVVVGAGQTGLAVSLGLTRRGVDHVVLERGRLAERWRSERWDSLTLLTPNWMSQLPGFPYQGSDPDGFDARAEYVRHLEAYARSFAAPVRGGTTVRRVARASDGRQFTVATSRGSYEARNVVVATGPFHEPVTPPFAASVPASVVQLHSSAFRNARQLPDGAVLVVGGGNSGTQIAADLHRNGREVYLSVGRLRPLPRRYRGKDAMWWLIQMGRLDQSVESLPSSAARSLPPPLLTGVGGGHDMDLRRLASEGMTLLGRIRGIVDGRAIVELTLRSSLAAGDEALEAFKRAADELVVQRGLDLPEAPDPPRASAQADVVLIDTLDLARARVTSVVWSTGFRTNFAWIDVPVFGADGEPLHRAGVTAVPGLYFVGLRWLTKYKSFFIYGVGEDTEFISDHVAKRAAQGTEAPVA